MKANKSADASDTLREIATLTFPNYKGSKISVEAADHVYRHVEGGDARSIDWLVDLSQIGQAGPNRPGNKVIRGVIPISIGVPILHGQAAQITVRPQASEFRCERFMIAASGTPGGAADWIVNDIRIGHRSQFVQSGDLPGDMFATDAIDAYVSFETAQVTMDIVVVVMYIGANESGAPFYASMIGTTNPPHSPHYIRVQQPAGASQNSLHTKIPFGFAYVSQLVRNGYDAGITIYIPPIDQATLDVAVDATLESGKSTPVVTKMIASALEGRGGLLHDAYVALVAQLAGALAAAEARAER